MFVTPNADGNNVLGGEQYIDVDLTTSLAQNYHIIGNGNLGTIPDQTYDRGNPLRPTIYVVPIGDNNSNRKLQENIDYTVEYTNNTEKGNVGKITVTGKGAYQGTLTETFNVVAKPIANAQVVTYATVKGQKPKVDVYDGSIVVANKLTENTDYTITYNTSTAGSNKGSVTISGQGNYSGTTRTYYFNVSNYALTASDVTVNGNANGTGTESVYYTGTTRNASTVRVKNGTVSSANYYLEYEYTKDNKITKTPQESGNYRIYVVGTGTEYAGRVCVGTFIIMPIPLDWTEIVPGATYYDSYYKAYVPKVTLRTKSGYPYGYSGTVTIKDTEYDVTYRYVNSTSTYLKPTIVVTRKETAVNLGPASDSKTKEVTSPFTVTKRSLSTYCTVTFTNGRSSAAYTAGGVSLPAVTVKDGSKTLALNTDYKVTYKNAAGTKVTTSTLKDAGTYSVVVEGIGEYDGSQTLTYTITGTDIGNYTVTLKESKVNADGRSKTPVITSVAYGYASKLNTTDYTVSYQDSTGKEVKAYQMSAPGTYRVVVTGKNGYTGSCYANFTIEGLAQSITGVESSYKIYPTSDAFKLQAKATEGVITYTSSDPSVASVDAYGYVTPHKAGRAKITISTTGNVKYNPANDSTVIKVYPNKAKLTRKPWKTGNGKIKVRWNKQDNVTRYEVRYARNKSFKKGTYKTKKRNAAVNSYTTQSTTISGLRSGYTYYVKVRAVKEVYNDYGKKLTYYGRWSGWKSVRA